MFNSDLLIELIKQAQGDRSLNQFAKNCGIDPGNLSRIVNNKNAQAPKPETLRKIASHAHNSVTYEDLMKAAGHIVLNTSSEDNSKNVLSTKDEMEIEKKIQSLREDLLNNTGGLMLSGDPVSPEAIESIVEALAFGIRQAKIINKKYTPNKYKE